MNRRRLSRSLAASLLALICAVSLDAQTVPKKPVKKKAPATKSSTPPAAAKAEPAPTPPPPPAGVRMHTTLTTGAQVSQNSTLIQGARQRVEFPGMTVIQQCDLGRTLQVNDASKRYIITKHAPPPAPVPVAPAAVDTGGMLTPEQSAQMQQMAQMQHAGHQGQPPQGGVVTWSTTNTDTGERKELFGRQARHVKTVTMGQSSERACTRVNQRVEVDAWYVEMPEALAGCTPKAESQSQPADPGACVDRTVTRQVGDVKLGFPVLSTTTTTSGEGTEADTNAMTMEVDAFEVTQLSASLFDVPDGYTEASSYADLLPSMATGGTLSDALLGSVADGTRHVKPKDAGAIRIGVVPPANKTAREVAARQLQQELVGNFTKWPHEGVPLYGDTPEALQQDALAKECDYILTSTVTEAKTSKPGKMAMLKVVTGEGPPTDNHDVKMEYKLFALDAPQKARVSSTAKANSGGGFGLTSALKLAAFAGQMYMGMGGMRMMSGFGAFGGAMGMMGGGMPGMGMFNPTMGAMNMALSGASTMAMAGMGGGGMGMGGMDVTGMQSEQAFNQTMSKALDNVSGSVTTELKKGAGARK